MNTENTGIYKITNTINCKFYIGSAAISFRRRWTQHRSDLKKNKHRNRHLQSSYNKHGESVFIYEILEICHPDKCIEREQHYLDTLKPTYNINPTAESAKGRKASVESIEKNRKAHLGQKAWNKGKSFPEESKRKMSESAKIKCATPEWKAMIRTKLKGKPSKNKGFKHSEETKRKFSEAQKLSQKEHKRSYPNRKRVKRICPIIRDDGVIYQGIWDVMEKTGLQRHDVTRSCDVNFPKRIRKDGHIYSYLKDPLDNSPEKV